MVFEDSDAPLAPLIASSDEALLYYRPNVLCRTFPIHGLTDRTLIYGILWIGECLLRLKEGMTETEANETLAMFASKGLYVPGEPRFSLNSLFPPVRSSQEAGSLIIN